MRLTRLMACIAVTAPFCVGTACAAEVKVMISGGFSAAYRDLISAYERDTGTKVVTSRGGSIGNAPTAIPNRLKNGEPADVLIMAGEALDELVKQGHAVAGSRVDLARSLIGVAVRAGAPRPDIRTVDAFRSAMLNAKSIAYSSSASGVYLANELFPRLGIAEQLRAKSRKVEGEPVGALAARGEAEIALQQVSELLPVPGIDYVGPLPSEIQKVTFFSAGLATRAQNTDGARALIAFLSSPAAAAAIAKSGLEPVTSPR